MSQIEYVGIDSIYNLEELLKKHNPKNIFLVKGKGSYESCGAKEVFDNLLRDYKVTVFDDFEINPKLNDIELGLDIYKKNKCDFLIVVGGGSAIDVAKSIRIFAANPDKPVEYVTNEKKISSKGNPLVAVPTTIGSGSEATKFAVIYIEKTKYSLDNEFVRPDYAIIDAKFTMSLPKYQAASTGMDTFTQAVEAYWCIHSTDESKEYSREAIELLMKYLVDAVNNADQKIKLEARAAVARAAHLAGKAINIAKTTASHAISYPITSYFGVSHGHAAALTIAEMLEYNSEVTKQDLLDNRGVEYVRKTVNEIVGMLGAKNVHDAKIKIEHMMDEIGLKRKLSELKIETENDVETIIKNGFNPGRVKNNPRLLTEESLRKILQEIR